MFLTELVSLVHLVDLRTSRCSCLSEIKVVIVLENSNIVLALWKDQRLDASKLHLLH